MANETCIVTGSAGFIGSHLTDMLLKEGYTVRGIDNYSTGRPENVSHVTGHPNFKQFEADITDVETIAPIFEGADWVFHLAALADIVPSIQNPFGYHRSNVDGTMNVLECARRAGVKRFVYAASSSCYGLADVLPTPENAEMNPMYPYALTKYVGEEYVSHWNKVYGLPTVSLRLFNVYGPRSRTSGTYGAVFGVFLAQKLAGEPLTVVGDGTQTRDFTFVTDVARGFMMAAQSDLSGEIINIGSDNHYSVNYLVELLGGEKVHIPKRPGEPDCTFADVTKAHTLLKWKPEVSFEEGVKVMIDNIDYWSEAVVWKPDTIADATADWFKYLGKS